MPDPDRPLVVARASSLGLDIGEPQVDSLLAFTELLRERALPLGLVASGDADRVLERHVLDCLRAAPVVRELGATTAVDLGSGAGLPGIVLATVLPDVLFVLAEARARRAAFIELAVERLGLANATVHPRRVEELESGFDVATARAFAPLATAWGVARGVLLPGGSLVFFAGRSEVMPAALPGARSIATLPAGPPAPHEASLDDGVSLDAGRSTIDGAASTGSSTSPDGALASGGDLVMITAT